MANSYLSAKYANILSFIAENAEDVSKGKTLLGVFHSQQHLKDWLRLDKTEQIRIFEVPSGLLPLRIAANKDDVLIIGIVIESESGDMELVYHEYQ